MSIQRPTDPPRSVSRSPSVSESSPASWLLSALRSGPVLLATAVALALALAPLGFAQDDDTIADLGFGESVNVNVVNVDVYVTDREGQRIRGLTAADFQLTVDKRPVPISNFYAVDGGRVVAGGTPLEIVGAASGAELRRCLGDSCNELFFFPVVGAAAPGRAVQLVRAETPADQRLHLIVYIDNFNIAPFNRNRVIRAVRNFLREELDPDDRVMLVTYDRALEVRQPFTSDPELVARALYRIEEMTGMRVTADNDRRDMIEQIYSEDRDLYFVRGRATQYAESIHNDVSFTLDALQQQVEMLAGLPGRKAIFYVSDGVPMRPGEDIFYALNDRFRDTSVLIEGHRYDLSRRFQSLITAANSHRVSFYTVDAAGLRTFTSMDAASRGPGAGPLVDQTYFNNLQAPLRFMAEETGGFVVMNTNNFRKPLDRMAADFDSYYSLGFVPASDVSGRYHRIEVELKEKRRGVDVRHRDGYRDKPLDTVMSERALAALELGFGDNPLGVDLEVVKIDPGETRDQFLVTLVVKVPMDRLEFLPQSEMMRARVRLYIAARDREGGLAEVQEVPMPIDIPVAEWDIARRQQYHYTLTLLMRGGRQVVGMGVRDQIGATASFVTEAVQVR
ncbi:MAG: VWA domain-containing protein [Acidobacteriota bacterium]